MHRVLVIGPSGAGKTTVATRIGRAAGLPVTHLDPLFWTADWRPVPRAEAAAALAAVVSTERWVIDGDFLDADAPDPTANRWSGAEVVVWLDLPVVLCLVRALRRWITGRGRSRPDLPVGGRETFDAGNLRQIASYGRRERAATATRLAALPPAVTVHRLRSRTQVARFLADHCC